MYIAIIIIAALIVGALGVNFPFAFDDFDILNWVKENLGDKPFWTALKSSFIPSLGGRFYPLRNIIDVICYRIFGLNSSFFYHLLGVILHVIVALCCFFLASHITKNRLLSFAAAFLFAIFPYHYWSIWWIANYSELLTFALFLSSFLAFIKWIEGEGIGFLIASIIAVNFSFLSSYQSAIYPLAFVLYAVIFFERIKINKIKMVLFLFLALACDIIWFSFRSNYAAGDGGIIANFLYHSFDVWQKIPMFNIFIDPRMPAGRPVTFFLIFVLTAILFFDIKKSGKMAQFLVGAVALFAGSLIFIKLGTSLLVKYLSTGFFVYYLIFGSKIERFFVCLAAIFALIFFTVDRPMLCSRYLYPPNFAFCILIAILLVKNIDRLFVSVNIKKSFLIVFLSGFTLMSVYFIMINSMIGVQFATWNGRS